ncbi:MAG: tetratricopeptide repeat protein, partial [Rhizobiaceae bacterium]
IKGKTIALDVYGRDPAIDGDPENVVRVDARRLRRTLADYYETEGAQDLVRIHIDSGGYAPRFELQSELSPSNHKSKTGLLAFKSRRGLLAGLATLSIAVIGLVVFGLGYQFLESNPKSQDSIESNQRLKREVLLDHSTRTLQASNLASQARQLTLPLFDIGQQKIASNLFRKVIELDPKLPDGYAGLAQTLCSIAILTEDPSVRKELLAEATNVIATAISHSPTNAWVQSAAAWIAFGKKDYDRADSQSLRAAKIAPDDGHVLDIRALILLFSGKFEEALLVSDPASRSDMQDGGLGHRNIHAAAQFFLGRPADTLKTFEVAGLQGAPVSPPRLAFQAAAYSSLGRLEEARDKVSELNRDWPNTPIDRVLKSVFQNPKYAELISAPIRKLGWKTTGE